MGVSMAFVRQPLAHTARQYVHECPFWFPLILPVRKRAYAMFGGGIRLAYAARVGVSNSVFERNCLNAILFEFCFVDHGPWAWSTFGR